MTIQGSLKFQSFKQWELAQLDRHGTGNTTIIGSRVQVLLEVTFLLSLIFSNTILADLKHWSIYVKTRMLTNNQKFDNAITRNYRKTHIGNQ